MNDQLSDLHGEINNSASINNHLHLNARDQQPLFKRLLNIYLETGFTGVLEELCENNQTKNKRNGTLFKLNIYFSS